MKIIRKRGDTSNILQVFIQDSSSTTGAGLTALANNTSGLTAYYHRDVDTTATAISLVSMTVGTFTSSGFKEIDATNMPGWYQFCPPDAALAATSTPHSVGFHLKGAANMAPLAIECQLIAADIEDSVRLGLTALPNAAAGATNGLPLSVDSSGRVDTLKINGTSQTAGDIFALATTIASYIDTEVANIQSRLPAALTGAGNIKADAQVVSDKTGYALTADFRIKKNTALAAFPFRMTDSSDHVSPKTGLTVTGQVSLDGGSFGSLANAVSEISSGWYKVSLAAADLNADTVALKFTATGADQLDLTITTQTE